LQGVNRAATLNFTLYMIPEIVVNFSSLVSGIGMLCGMDS
jgi:hypothetical protein